MPSLCFESPTTNELSALFIYHSRRGRSTPLPSRHQEQHHTAQLGPPNRPVDSDIRPHEDKTRSGRYTTLSRDEFRGLSFTPVSSLSKPTIDKRSNHRKAARTTLQHTHNHELRNSLRIILDQLHQTTKHSPAPCNQLLAVYTQFLCVRAAARDLEDRKLVAIAAPFAAAQCAGLDYAIIVGWASGEVRIWREGDERYFLAGWGGAV